MAGEQNPGGSLALFSRSPFGEGRAIMLRLATGIYGAIALSLTLGAVQFALGRDLSGAAQTSALDVLDTSAPAINRAAKADRSVGAATAPGGQTRTISVRLDGLSDTSVVIRIPVAREVRDSSSISPSLINPSTRKIAVACEPVVSVLTEVARQLQPGRCVT
jgi:hypothetical protein